MLNLPQVTLYGLWFLCWTEQDKGLFVNLDVISY